MDSQENDLGYQFAQLTGVFEDVAGLSSKGQGADVSTSERLALLKTLNNLNRKAQSILYSLHKQLDTSE